MQIRVNANKQPSRLVNGGVYVIRTDSDNYAHKYNWWRSRKFRFDDGLSFEWIRRCRRFHWQADVWTRNVTRRFWWSGGRLKNSSNRIQSDLKTLLAGALEAHLLIQQTFIWRSSNELLAFSWNNLGKSFSSKRFSLLSFHRNLLRSKLFRRLRNSSAYQTLSNF